jgi:hypothetical protein
VSFLRGPFADPRFRRLLAGQSLSSFGDTALYLTLGIWAKALTGSNAAAGGVFLALGLPALAARPPVISPTGYGAGRCCCGPTR